VSEDEYWIKKKNVFITTLGIIGCVTVPEYDLPAVGDSKLTELKNKFYPYGSQIAIQSTVILIELVNEK